ncbi:glycosyltransferase family 2 protein [Mesobacterium pallidum]|uniref:glycosyltransferase family 2 protein n=1 Tax=Mesobacterium pallidum TaxID=2872037 RepID=UPI001EE32F3D|nr:glycosyltransferase family A protein [Mesobacterium pallidum]
MSDATAIINVHREGALLVPTLRSLSLAREVAAKAGFDVRFDVVADRIDDRTQGVLDQFAEVIDRVDHVDFGNLSQSREHGIRAAETDIVFLHDGDDLYSSNWYKAVGELVARGHFDLNTVYHTRLFARFGALYDVSKTPDSYAMSFDPHSLLVDWYFSNKCAFHRSLVSRYPLPPIDPARGIGNEDWSWSADTIAEGVRHMPLPETICFYRMKPHHLSLGAKKGVMQGPSKLFSAERARDGAARRRRAPLSMLPPNAGLDLPPLSAWPAEELGAGFDHELKVQGAFEQLLTAFPRHGHTGAALVQEKDQYPGLGRLYRQVAARLGDGSRNLLWLPAHLPMARDQVIDWVDEALALSAGDSDPAPLLVLFDEAPTHEVVLDLDRWGAVGLNLARFAQAGLCGDYQLTRFLARFLLQGAPRMSVDAGSMTLNRLVQDFPTTYARHVGTHAALLTHRRIDWADPALAAAIDSAQRLVEETGTATPVIGFAEATAQALDTPGLEHLVEGDTLIGAADAMTAERFRRVADHDHAPAGFTTEGPAILARLMARAERPRPPIEARTVTMHSGGLVQQGDLLMLRSPTAQVDPWFEEAARRIFDARPEVRVVLPAHMFFRTPQRDNAVWLPAEPAAESLRMVLDVMAYQPPGALPYALALRATDKALAETLASEPDAFRLFVMLSTACRDTLAIAKTCSVMPGTTTW